MNTRERNSVQKQDPITRPLLRYHGGKFRLAPWIISYFPKHRVYVEPFAGAASVLMQKSRSYAEVINDRDEEVVNLFRMCRTRGSELQSALALTPYSRDAFYESFEPTTDELERARRTVVRSFMGFSSGIQDWVRTGFRTDSNTKGPPLPGIGLATPKRWRQSSRACKV